MSRNIEQMISEGRQIIAANRKHEMNTGEAFGLYDLYTEEENTARSLRIIHAAFLFGIAAGHRIGKSEQNRDTISK
ncbi:MAG: hypothetical protein IK990_05670 [Ruminiclostridium sp.]|nr:hypothetical protein [Ruminiclostridium sp.]